LAAHDVDQEIKECALLATSSLLSELHPSLVKKQTTRLSVLLLERLKNETTRIPALRTLSAICSSPQGTEIDFAGPKGNQGILKPALEVMAGFLQMQSRSLRQTALEALDVVIQHHGSTIKPKQLATDLYSSLLQELAELVVDTDLHISHLSLRASISALKVCPDAGPSVKDHLLPRVLVLSSSPLLQDLALESLLAHLEQVVISNAVDFQELLEMLRGRLEKAAESKHAIYNLAQCIAVITSVTTPENQQGVVTEFLQTLDGSVTPSSEGEEIELRKVQLALLVSGDLGRMVDLGTIIMDDVKDDDTNVPSKLTTIYMGYFDSPSEDLTNASSYALGRAAVGDTQSIFLQAIVNSLDDDNNEKQQYLLLSALRGFIQSSYAQSGGEGIASNLPLILPHVINHASDEKEGVRSMAAECLGSLTCMQPAIMCEKLCTLAEEHSAITVTEKGTVEKEDTTSQKNAYVCWTVAISFKHAIAGKADPAQLTQSVPKLLTLLLDQKELGARNATLLMVYSAVHHMPQLVSGSIMKEQITPALYEVAAFKLERKIDLGPFSHKVDDALPLRKAALSIFATSLENLPGSFDIGPFLPVLKLTLKDVEDIQLQAHQIVIAMCARPHTTSYMVAAAEDFVEPLEKTMHKKVGTKTGTELERLIDWKKSALRTMVALSKVEGTMNSRKFADFVERISANSKFRAALEAIKEER